MFLHDNGIFSTLIVRPCHDRTLAALRLPEVWTEHVGNPGQGRFEQRRVVLVRPRGDQMQRIPPPSQATDRFIPCLPRSTGLRPATSPGEIIEEYFPKFIHCGEVLVEGARRSPLCRHRYRIIRAAA